VGLTVGLPRIHLEAGEHRDFLPTLVRELVRLGADQVVLEEGYGTAVDVAPEAYLGADRCVRFTGYDECLAQDVVVVLRCPREPDLRRIRSGAILVTMLHYPTRPVRNALLRELGIVGVSLDGVIDDRGRRLVQNMELVGWAGVGVAFLELARTREDFAHPGRAPIHVTCLGSGAVGASAIHAASRYGDPELRTALHERGVPGVEAAVVDHDLSWHEDYMLQRLRCTDLLIDASRRQNTAVPAVLNRWIGAMPEDAILLDLSADPYDLNVDPPAVKGIEGVPHGTLDGYVFEQHHPAWDAIGAPVDVTNRRLALSCNAWPGVRPRASMALYGEQLEDVMDVVLSKPVERWDVASPHHAERAVARAELSRWMTAQDT
jgi:alanine dehydrogenase